MHRLDARQRQVQRLAPGEETRAGARIGGASVQVADVGGEEVEIAPGCPFATIGDDRRHDRAGRQRRQFTEMWSDLVHAFA